ncbi:AraC family transcriptional regulator [Paenibacillus sp. OVF10]|nr:AraC family transcriptional regulator [Paenibacillus sp. OVF10]
MNKIMDEIIDLMKYAGTRPIATEVPGLSMIKGDIPAHQLAALYEPMIGFTVQGTKILSIGERSITLGDPHIMFCRYMFPQRRGYIQTLMAVLTCPLVLC